MSDNNQSKKSSAANNTRPEKIGGTAKINTDDIKGGRVTSQAPPKPVKPAKGN